MNEYKIAIITFFDILGFGQLVEKNNNPENIFDVLSLVKKSSEPDGELASLYDMSFVNFSDTVVRTKNILSETNLQDPPGILFHEILDMVHIQVELAARGIFIRGSITIGKIFVENGLIYGPGLVRAYKLESKIASYPRIIIDPDLLKIFDGTNALKSSIHTHDMEKGYLKNLLRKDIDGLWFIDYLRGSEIEFEDAFDYYGFLLKNANVIRKATKDLKELNDVVQKYSWLANYHNSVVEEYMPGIKKANWPIKGLRIGSKAIKPLYDI